MKKLILLLMIIIPGVMMAQQKQIPVYPLKQTVKAPVISKPAPQNMLRSDTYYQQCFGYFCKREWNWEKQTRVPIKLRLGTYQTAQRMEGKQ